GREEFEFNGHTVSFKAPFRRLNLREAAASAASERLKTSVTAADLRHDARAREIGATLGIELAPTTTAGKAATEIFERLWEEHLLQPPFWHDFPTEVSPLSKQRPDDPGTVERFELYVGGFEIANAFSELNDPVEQRRRFDQQLEEKKKGDAEAHAMDEDYVRALEYGLPPTGGAGGRSHPAPRALATDRTNVGPVLTPHLR